MARAIFRLRGRVVHASGAPAEGAIVALVDADPDLDDLIAVGVTGADGVYRASFTIDAFNQEEGEDETIPDLYAMVSVANGASITPMVRHEIGKLGFEREEDVGDIRLPPPFQIPPLGSSSLRIAPGRGKIVRRVRLDDELIGIALDEVAPIVEELTGFTDLRRDVRFVILDDFFENRRARWERRIGDKLSAKQLSRILEQARECDASLVAEWDADTREVLLNRQFLEAQSYDFLKTSLGHELVHVGQTRSSPENEQRYRELTRRTWPYYLSDAPVPVEILRELTQHMANIEGYAEYIESYFLQKLYTHAELLGHAVRAADDRFRNLRATRLTDEQLAALTSEDIFERYGASKRIQYVSGARAYAAIRPSGQPAPFDPGLRPPIIPDVERILLVMAAKVVAEANAPGPAKRVYPRERKCAACNAFTRVGEYHDPNIPPSTAAASGLDGRPGFDAMFLRDAFFIEACKACGHLAPNLESEYPRLAEVKAEREGLFALTGHDPRALRCIVVANLFADVDYLEEGRWSLRAAWFDEASGHTESASAMRRRAGYCLAEAVRMGRALSETRLVTSLVLAETFRVGRARDRALEHAVRGLRHRESAPERERELLLFELEAIRMGWTHPLTCGDALASFAMLEPEHMPALEELITTRASELPPLRLQATAAPIPEREATVFALDFMDETLMLDLLRDGRAGIWEAVSLRPRLLPALLRATGDADHAVRANALAVLSGKAFPFPAAVVKGSEGAFGAVLERIGDRDKETVQTAIHIVRELLLLDPSFAPRVATHAREAMQSWQADHVMLASLSRLLEAAGAPVAEPPIEEGAGHA